MAHSPGPYRIAVVAELTGVPEPTLRAWERRYEIPTPRRTSSGYRLYGEREIEQVRRMRSLCESGMSPSEAAKRVARERSLPNVRDPYVAAREAFLAALESFDDAALDGEARRLTFLGPAPFVVEEVIVPLLREVGERWAAGELSVAQEHLASQKIEPVLRDFLRLANAGDASVIVASAADDQHELGALALAVHLGYRNLRPVFFGARTPPDALASAIARVRPAAVALSVTIAPERERARELASAYAKACGRVPWAVGGLASGEIADLVRGAGGHVTSDVDVLEEWIEKKRRR